jgi:hypothetical protein
MNRRIGRLIQIGLFAALPVGWTATAFAQSTTGSAVGSDTGINPLPKDDSSSLTKDQKKAGDIDQNLGNPATSDVPGAQGVGNRSDTMGTSGSSGSTQGEKKDQSGSQMGGSSGAVPGSVDTNDIQKSSGQDEKTTDKPKPKSTAPDQTDVTNPDKEDFGSSRKMDDSTKPPADSSDITK